MKNLAIITDVHGCFKTLLALIAKIPADHEVILAGDLIDRGPDSKGVVDFAMRNKLRCILGNHEDMMLDHILTSRRYEPSLWLYNGGRTALESWSGKVPDEVVRWVNDMPFSIKEGSFEISHTGYGGFDKGSRVWRLWARHGSDCDHLPDDGIFRVFGHTQRKEPWVESTFAMIDTGCAYVERKGLGKLTAMLLPSKQIIQQENIEPEKSVINPAQHEQSR